MSLNAVTSGERVHIAFFGMRNAGKSSLVNAVTGQNLSVVSDVKGTTTDPVKKAMELLPLGPVVIIDTPGLDDDGQLGALRVQKAHQILEQTDLAVLVIDATVGASENDRSILAQLKERKLPFVIAFNKADLIEKRELSEEEALYVSAFTGEGISALKERLGAFVKKLEKTKVLVSDLLQARDVVILVTPIDESAPKGRLILPQQMVLRDILDSHACAIVCQDTELKHTLSKLAEKPKMVITDSQVFGRVSADTPDDILLTSFSVLMARYKGELAPLIQGANALKTLKDGDKVLISEGCTHHRQCNDIGTVKMPAWIENFSGTKLQFSFTSGNEYPEDLSEYALVVHCGGCMLNDAAMHHRIEKTADAGVPIINYGLAIAHMNGILERSLRPFK
ncbi:MAG: [FeFe] hydrogenase H-cluster maturation GTPase HydF [Ruminococcaceae bacterium]|nr:[FeFe] hydrogenase H-cluster maturation GTPase HydF [Oscillospiraceae bacterium]